MDLNELEEKVYLPLDAHNTPQRTYITCVNVDRDTYVMMCTYRNAINAIHALSLPLRQSVTLDNFHECY